MKDINSKQYFENCRNIVNESSIDKQAIIDHSLYTTLLRDGPELSYQRTEDSYKKYGKGESIYQNKKYLYDDIYAKYCLIVSTIILTPINDMVMWFESLTLDTPLTVYNAGNAHIVGLFYFLVTRGYYNPVTELLGYDLFKSNPIDSHCISFADHTEHISLDSVVYRYQTTKEQKKKRELVINRYDALGPDVFFDILRGKIQSEQDLLQNSHFISYIEENKIDFHSAINQLELSQLHAIVPNEYVGQLEQ